MSTLDLEAVYKMDPLELHALLTAYMGGREGFFFGGYIVGFLFDAIMLGLVLHQFVHWWQWSRGEDRMIVRLLVYYSTIFSIGISVFLTIWIFHMFVYGFGNYAVFLEINWMSWWFLVDVVIRVPVQAFFAERAWRMAGRTWWFAGIMGTFYALILGIVVKIVVVRPELGDLSTVLILVWLSVEIGSDVIVTSTIAYCLWKSRTGWSGTDKLIGRLLRLILETQFPPTIFAIIFMILFLVEREGSTSRFFVCSPKVYVICLLAVLNSRHSLRKDLSADQTYTKGNSYVLRGMRGNNTGINVTTETYTHVTRDPFPPTRSVNREPKMYDLEVTEQDGTNSTDKDVEDIGTSELGYSSSAVRLTGGDDDKREVRFGA